MTNNDMITNLIDACSTRGWDKKDWARSIGVRLDELLFILDTKQLNESMYKELLARTKKNKLNKLMKFSKPQVISYNLHKGGVGKTVLSTGHACILAEMGYNVLFLDGDSQRNATSILVDLNSKSVQEFSKKYNFFDAITGSCTLEECIMKSKVPNLDVIMGSAKTSNLDVAISQMPYGEHTLENCISDLLEVNYYDFIIIDTDKNLGALNKNIFTISNFINIVVEYAPFAIDGIPAVLSQIDIIKKYTNNHSIQLLGIIVNKVDTRESAYTEYKNILDENYGEYLYKTKVRANAKIKIAQGSRIPLNLFDKQLKASRDIEATAKEMLLKIQKYFDSIS